ncbi:MAG: hypothetical protein ACR2QF_11020 [Geminicoccaceae bacterium]
MTVELPIIVFSGVLALAILAIVLLFILAGNWVADNRRHDEAMNRHLLERRGWEARDRAAWLYVDQLTREIAELRGMLNIRRVKSKTSA